MTGTTTVESAYAPAVTPYRRARGRLRTFVSGQPGYLAFARRRYTGHNVEVIGPRTELVIDGFTRSATTFAVYAFQLSQDTPVQLAHHLHAPAQLIQAARRGVPAVALIRKPQGAVLSQLIQEPDVALPDALFAYSRFYERLMPYRGGLVIGEFGQVTEDFGAVIRQVNERFGTDFAEFAHSDESVRQVFELSALRETYAPGLLSFESGLITREQLRGELEAIHGAARQQDVPPESWVPSVRRDQIKEALRTKWQEPSVAKVRYRAEQAYQAFLAGSA